jgi:hypothetical protein
MGTKLPQKTKDDIIRCLKMVFGEEAIDSTLVELLEKDFYFDEYIESHGEESYESWKSLVDRVKTLKKFVESYRKSGRHIPDAPRLQIKGRALLALQAVEARHRPCVLEFREKVLNGRLLSVEEVEDWIRYQQQQDGEPTAIFHSRDGTVIGRSLDILSIPMKDGVVQEPIRYGGVLWQLKFAADELRHILNWEEDEAVLFILTDRPPMPWFMRSVYSQPLDSPHFIPIITLSFPVWADDREVLWLLRQTRKANKIKTKLGRPLSEKMSRLIEFVAPLLSAEGKPSGGWEAVCKRWNEKYPEWKFESSRRLCSRFLRAQKSFVFH